MVGVQIAVLRRGAGMTQAELARHIHVSASAIGMYEQGRRLPAAPILVALSQVFEVTIDYLVTGEPCLPKDFEKMKRTRIQLMCAECCIQQHAAML